MKHNVMLTVASLLSILFMTFHLTDDPRRYSTRLTKIVIGVGNLTSCALGTREARVLEAVTQMA
jgi:hypothetical protein